MANNPTQEDLAEMVAGVQTVRGKVTLIEQLLSAGHAVPEYVFNGVIESDGLSDDNQSRMVKMQVTHYGPEKAIDWLVAKGKSGWAIQIARDQHAMTDALLNALPAMDYFCVRKLYEEGCLSSDQWIASHKMMLNRIIRIIGKAGNDDKMLERAHSWSSGIPRLEAVAGEKTWSAELAEKTMRALSHIVQQEFEGWNMCERLEPLAYHAECIMHNLGYEDIAHNILAFTGATIESSVQCKQENLSMYSPTNAVRTYLKAMKWYRKSGLDDAVERVIGKAAEWSDQLDDPKHLSPIVIAALDHGMDDMVVKICKEHSPVTIDCNSDKMGVLLKILYEGGVDVTPCVEHILTYGHFSADDGRLVMQYGTPKQIRKVTHALCGRYEQEGKFHEAHDIAVQAGMGNEASYYQRIIETLGQG